MSARRRPADGLLERRGRHFHLRGKNWSVEPDALVAVRRHPHSPRCHCPRPRRIRWRPRRSRARGRARHQAAESPAWSWSPDANVFFGCNYQLREFRDQSAWESQNWFMLPRRAAARPRALRLESMTFARAVHDATASAPRSSSRPASRTEMGPLIDRQHPHDLFMELGATYRHAAMAARDVHHVGPIWSWPRSAGAYDAVHAPRVGAQQPAGAALPSSARFHAHQPGCVDGRYRGGLPDAAGIVVSADRNPTSTRLEHRPAVARFLVGAGKWQRGPWMAQVSGGILHEARLVRAMRHPAHHGLD